MSINPNLIKTKYYKIQEAHKLMSNLFKAWVKKST